MRRQPLFFKLIEAIFLLSCKQFINQTGCRVELYPHSLPACLIPNSSRNMGCTNPGVAYQQDIFSSSDIFSLHKFQYLRFIHGWYSKKVKAFKCFDYWKARLSYSSLDPIIFSLVYFLL